MRYLLLSLMALFIATPVFAESSVCKMTGPHNCVQQSEEQLVDITKNTIHQMQLTHGHAFKTENDVILEAAARQQAQLNNNNISIQQGYAFARN